MGQYIAGFRVPPGINPEPVPPKNNQWIHNQSRVMFIEGPCAAAAPPADIQLDKNNTILHL